MLNRFRLIKFINPISLFFMFVFDASLILTIVSVVFLRNHGIYDRSTLVMFITFVILLLRGDLRVTPHFRRQPSAPETPESDSTHEDSSPA
jgi:hypothetical protein